ncbi:MAG: GTP-binding protein [Butyrivibrio sp.]|nr:GTP-binding protein [Butyrivibrio sp.]
MKILLVSGFLGAGKTTFIKELITRTGTFPAILENEYGDNSIDSRDLQQAAPEKEELKILEFMEGCVCCTMKDSFVNSVLAVYSSLDPEYLIIEPTGVGKLSNIIENLKPILVGNVSLLKPIVVLSPESYSDNIKEWPELYKDQVANAQTVVFSKCEKSSLDVLSKAEEEIRKINPHANITKGHYSNMDAGWWNALMRDDADEQAVVSDADKESSEENFSQVTLDQAGLFNPAELVQFLEDCLRGEYGHVARAKGTLWVGKELIRFDLADRMYIFSQSPEDICQSVFIGKYLDEKKLKNKLCGSRRARLK